MSCSACGRGFHKECLSGCGICHPDIEDTPVAVIEGERKKGSTADGLKDPKSTGRKRAAILYPLDAELDCEWRNKKNCGGGFRPIIGCLDGKQKHRHHGPVKDTTRNHEGNVHRICTRCHNHWHELNDLVYDQKKFNSLPHDPEEATIEEIIAEELEWQNGTKAKNFELASSHNKKLKKDLLNE